MYCKPFPMYMCILIHLLQTMSENIVLKGEIARSFYHGLFISFRQMLESVEPFKPLTGAFWMTVFFIGSINTILVTVTNKGFVTIQYAFTIVTSKAITTCIQNTCRETILITLISITHNASHIINPNAGCH